MVMLVLFPDCQKVTVEHKLNILDSKMLTAIRFHYHYVGMQLSTKTGRPTNVSDLAPDFNTVKSVSEWT